MVARQRASATNRQAAPAQRRQRPAVEEAPPVRKRRPAAAAPEPEPTGRDVTVYATKDPTDFHKAFAKWIVTEVGYRPSQAESLKAAFLAGVSIATAARPAFNDSEWLENWREENGVAKRGRPKASTKAEPEPVEEEDDDFEDADDAEDDDVDEDDDFEDDADEADDADDDDDFDEPAPAPVKRTRPAKAAPAKAQARRAAPTKAAPTKAAQGTRRAKPADDEFAF